MTTSVQVLSGPLDDERRGALVFDGHLLVFTSVPALVELAELSQEVIPDPVRETDIEQVKDQFRRNPRVVGLVRVALEQVGLEPARTYWDRPRLRIVPPATDREVGTIGFHRDTWGSNLLAQTNWWLPLRPLTHERTIAFYPEYWSKPIANTSADWDLAAIRERRRAGLPLGDLPIVPSPTTPPRTDSELRVVLEPGDLLCFSGAHLHASVPNTSAGTRVSAELRTINSDDLAHGRGAPDLDGDAPGTQFQWFRSITDGSPLRGSDGGTSPPPPDGDPG
ncbi:hypothetical protein [Nocardioides sp. GXQ0305]|uniref:hypothetical protein n=1 Tax=Nocardioides sp. GXQ0305 TaxID=3423912 RepID=UPI003D7CD129